MAENLKAAIEKVEQLVKTLAGDVSDLARSSAKQDTALDAHGKMLEQLVESQGETDSALRSMAASQASMASAVTHALTQLSIAQTFEKRLEKLEATVFPSKH